jgi:hypothetical protein
MAPADATVGSAPECRLGNDAQEDEDTGDRDECREIDGARADQDMIGPKLRL